MFWNSVGSPTHLDNQSSVSRRKKTYSFSRGIYQEKNASNFSHLAL